MRKSNKTSRFSNNKYMILIIYTLYNNTLTHQYANSLDRFAVQDPQFTSWGKSYDGYLMWHQCLVLKWRVHQYFGWSWFKHEAFGFVQCHVPPSCSLWVIEISSSKTLESLSVFSSFISQGHTVDTNSTFLTRALRKLGVSVQRITVIPDIQEVIAKEVALLSPQYTHLITSGGIGPTHDDVTFESIAMAFQEELHPHPELTRLVEEFFGVEDKNSAAMKLAMVPRSAKLNYGTDPQTGQSLRYPLVSEHKMGGRLA